MGNVAAKIYGAFVKEVDYYLHGSFQKTYKGHGTDAALVAGLLGMDTDDERLPYALEMAKEQGVRFSFREAIWGLFIPTRFALS